MALSGKVGASLVRLNSAACAPSLNEEILRSTPSAVSPSIMSQPVRKASAPRLAAPRRKPRRAGSGINLAASLISSLGSTPGMILLWRMILFPRNHGAQALRHQQRQRHVYSQEPDDRAHCDEMHVAGNIVAAEQRGQFLELHRLPDRETRQHDHDAGEDHAGVKHLLHRVVVREIVMRELE